ncbi:HAMP domain-containing sensor histidine kinase [Paenibacillus sp. Marseille-Q4541]|uniref:sensor histidine kinase n=1 Tax=Paenibacillus sp. Marseille-Q4541 TaxID=2831522 RepID=UPI001BA7FB0A|nr:HAMP domain-containing sensor histidine kinase [Paenibacillus sp. Marseille-Q4541]
MSKLGRKLTFSISLAIIVIFAISILLTQFFLPKYYLYKTKEKTAHAVREIQEIDKALDVDATAVLASLEDKYNITIVYEPLGQNINNLNDQILTELARKKITLHKFWITEETLERLQDGETVNKLYDQEKLKSSFFSSFFVKDGALILVGISVAHFSETATIVNEFNLYMLGFSLLLVVTLVWLLSRKITTPLQDLKEVSQDIAELNFKTVRIRTHDEIEDLAHSINIMSGKLNQAHEELRQKNENLKIMMADLTHELKTPLALIRAYCMGIKDGFDDGTYLDTILRQTDHVSGVIEDLLHFAKMERDELHFTTFDVRGVLIKCLEPYQIETKRRDMQWNVAISSKPLFIHADEAKIEMVFMNFISNAVKYTADNRVTIDLEDKDDVIVFSIRNGAIMKNADMLEQIWEPFYVLDAARSKQVSGTGLGLAIVKSILVRHQIEHDVTWNGKEIIFTLIFKKES